MPTHDTSKGGTKFATLRTVNASPGWNPKILVGQTLESAHATTMNYMQKQKAKINLSVMPKIKRFTTNITMMYLWCLLLSKIFVVRKVFADQDYRFNSVSKLPFKWEGEWSFLYFSMLTHIAVWSPWTLLSTRWMDHVLHLCLLPSHVETLEVAGSNMNDPWISWWHMRVHSCRTKKLLYILLLKEVLKANHKILNKYDQSDKR